MDEESQDGFAWERQSPDWRFLQRQSGDWRSRVQPHKVRSTRPTRSRLRYSDLSRTLHMARPVSHPHWGNSPWSIDFQPAAAAMPAEADFAIIGGGFSGLSAAAWLRRFAPDKTVVLFESASIGAGSSGHTGGMVLAGAAAGDLSGLGD